MKVPSPGESIKEVEIATGINFNPKLPANATTLETNKSW